MRKISLSDLLKGCSPDYNNVQSIFGLTILPITTSKENCLNDYGAPFNFKVNAENYGSLVFYTHSDQPLLIPSAMTLYQEGSQDHAISRPLLVRKGQMVSDYNAMCIEEQQGGLFEEEKSFIPGIVPYALKFRVWDSQEEEGYSKVWEDIKKFNKVKGVNSKHGHLRWFYDRYGEELRKFIAHFEATPNCVGFFTFYRGELMAIDKFPNYDYYGKIWEVLLRECYATMCVGNDKETQSDYPFLPRLSDRTVESEGGYQCLDNIVEIYEQVVDDRIDKLKNQITILLEEELTVGGLVNYSRSVNSSWFVGDFIDDEGLFPLVSLVRRDDFNADSFFKGKEKRKLASEQKAFSL